MHDEALTATYTPTEYRVSDSPVGPLVIRVGEGNDLLGRLLVMNSATRWAYITACNPRSAIVPDDENRLRPEALRERLASFTTDRGEGIGADGHPPEASLLVLNIEETEAEVIGAEFGQNAVVVGQLGAAARLLGVSDRRSTEEGE
jgi:hypothetical protein